MNIGDPLPDIRIPITLHRLVMEAGANRDLSMIHHDTKIAQATGAPDAYANTFFLMGLFERQLREFIGLERRIKKIGPMQMKTFNCVGDVLTVKGEIIAIENGIVSIQQTIESHRGTTTVCQSQIFTV